VSTGTASLAPQAPRSRAVRLSARLVCLSPDVAKGSYYNNPMLDRPTEDKELMARFPAYCMPNVWPEGDDCPDLEPAFKALGRLIVSVGELVGAQIDAFAARAVPGYPPKYLQEVIRTSLDCKVRPHPSAGAAPAHHHRMLTAAPRAVPPELRGSHQARLLHYFPRADAGAGPTEPDSWCGWHLDHGALTGLTSAMYMRTNADGTRAEVPNPDPNAGLYIRSRAGTLVKAVIPPDCIGFQLGQQMQVASGGKLRATWHCVQAAEGPGAVGVARNTLAVFMQPNWDAVLTAPPGATEADVDVAEWKPGQTFAEFTEEVLKKYYAAGM